MFVYLLVHPLEVVVDVGAPLDDVRGADLSQRRMVSRGPLRLRDQLLPHAHRREQLPAIASGIEKMMKLKFCKFNSWANSFNNILSTFVQ